MHFVFNFLIYLKKFLQIMMHVHKKVELFFRKYGSLFIRLLHIILNLVMDLWIIQYIQQLSFK